LLSALVHCFLHWLLQSSRHGALTSKLLLMHFPKVQ
jgi:hypothetical protein